MRWLTPVGAWSRASRKRSLRERVWIPGRYLLGYLDGSRVPTLPQCCTVHSGTSALAQADWRVTFGCVDVVVVLQRCRRWCCSMEGADGSRSSSYGVVAMIIVGSPFLPRPVAVELAAADLVARDSARGEHAGHGFASGAVGSCSTFHPLWFRARARWMDPPLSLGCDQLSDGRPWLRMYALLRKTPTI